MIRLIAICILYLFFAGNIFSQTEKSSKQLPDIKLTPTELELYRQICEYRAQKGLPEVKLSKSLCFVARTHAQDQTANHKYGSRCNLHSWSDDGKWSSCCYTPDHKKAACMWDKPRELTNYPGDGYEISFYSTFRFDTDEATAKDILKGWKKSPGHNDVIINKNTWKNVEWNAMGVAVYGDYSNVWFGKETDNESEVVK
jgi:hypothetical protein